jgi:hypothetical protein
MREALGTLIDDEVQVPELLLSMGGVGGIDLIVDCDGDLLPTPSGCVGLLG